MEVGYVRVSKKDQNPDLQRRELVAAGCEKIFEERISSRKGQRPELEQAMEFCREGDRLSVWKTPGGKLVFHVFASIAEFERHHQREDDSRA